LAKLTPSIIRPLRATQLATQLKSPATAEVQAALPPAYAPFIPVLARLSEPLLQVLGGQLLQFERFARSIEVQRFAPQGEFEGLDGLTMRGEITHIVQSELLLRTEAPLEFLRRLAESETLFHQKSYADPGARAVYRAMVSIGPGMLGHGRLVALAALFFMARVAGERGAHFHWCYLPRADGAVWFEELSVNTVKRFMRAVSYREMEMRDVAEAQALWAKLEPAVLVRDTPDHIDWIVGADSPPSVRGGQGGRPVPAAAVAANAICHALLPPAADAAREARLLVRRGGKDVERLQILFPNDQVCVSAIRNPFKPLVPEAAATATAMAPDPPQGWEPLYFSTPRPDAKLVRMRDGLLIFVLDQRNHVAGSWFVPLTGGVMLAGVGVTRSHLSLAVQARKGSREVVAYRSYSLWGARTLHCAASFSKDLPTTHLFRSQRPFAVPPLYFAKHGLLVHSSFGQAFSFRSAETDGLVHFEMLHKEAKTLHANGVYRVTRMEESGSKWLRVLKEGHRVMAEFVEGPEKVTADRLLGMAFSPSETSLTYSLTPGRWVVLPAGRHRTSDAANPVDFHVGRVRYNELQLEAHQRLLNGRIVTGGVAARIWSDERRGGDGTVRTLRRIGDATTFTNQVVKLGADAGAIARVQAGDDGFWAVTLDDDATPRELLHYRLIRGVTNLSRFDLVRMADEAMRIELDPFDG
jgi:hypothetical protein